MHPYEGFCKTTRPLEEFFSFPYALPPPPLSRINEMLQAASTDWKKARSALFSRGSKGDEESRRWWEAGLGHDSEEGGEGEKPGDDSPSSFSSQDGRREEGMLAVVPDACWTVSKVRSFVIVERGLCFFHDEKIKLRRRANDLACRNLLRRLTDGGLRHCVSGFSVNVQIHARREDRQAEGFSRLSLPSLANAFVLGR